jgi:hypothetical protein
MKITRKLKYATFEYDEETKHFTIEAEDANSDSTEKKFFKIRLGKVYAFAFMRFVVRMAQRNWLRKTPNEKKSLDKADDIMLELDIEDPNQLTMFDQ